MDNKTIAIIAAVGIAILIFKPDLLSSIFRKNAGIGGGGIGGSGDVVIVPPVIPLHSTYYDVNIGAPTFPEYTIPDPAGQSYVGSSGGGGSCGGGNSQSSEGIAPLIPIRPGYEPFHKLIIEGLEEL